MNGKSGHTTLARWERNRTMTRKDQLDWQSQKGYDTYILVLSIIKKCMINVLISIARSCCVYSSCVPFAPHVSGPFALFLLRVLPLLFSEPLPFGRFQHNAS